MSSTHSFNHQASTFSASGAEHRADGVYMSEPYLCSVLESFCKSGVLPCCHAWSGRLIESKGGKQVLQSDHAGSQQGVAGQLCKRLRFPVGPHICGPFRVRSPLHLLASGLNRTLGAMTISVMAAGATQFRLRTQRQLAGSEQPKLLGFVLRALARRELCTTAFAVDALDYT